MLDQAISQAAALIRSATATVALTGAGVSTPSGIPDFRTTDSGLWTNTNPYEVASLTGFRRNPAAFYEWITPLAHLMLEAQPNPAHVALAVLEQNGFIQNLITQNIDMLHTRAGSRLVHEVHGHFREITCINCYTVYQAEPIMRAFLADKKIPTCPKCQGVLKPNVILYGEQLPAQVYHQARHAVRTCDVMLIAGSSLEVAPASELPMMAHQHNARLIIVNYQPTHIDHVADVIIREDVAHVLPRIAAAVVEKES